MGLAPDPRQYGNAAKSVPFFKPGNTFGKGRPKHSFNKLLGHMRAEYDAYVSRLGPSANLMIVFHNMALDETKSDTIRLKAAELVSKLVGAFIHKLEISQGATPGEFAERSSAVSQLASNPTIRALIEEASNAVEQVGETIDLEPAYD